jgi:hypothetical protein
MSEQHADTPEPPTQLPGGGIGHLLAAMEAMAAAIYVIGMNVPAAHGTGIHFRAAQEHLKHAREIFG